MSLTGSNLAHFNDAGAQPVVTIAIPTVDRVDYLRLAVESALAQTWSSIEVIVANNACTDGTAAYLATLTDPRLRNIVHPSRLSMVDNWNTIVAIATGKYFLLLSDDDLLHPTAIEQMVLRYETADRASTSIGFVYCSTRFIDKTGKTLSTTKSVPAIQTAKELILGVFGYTRKVMLCSILFRTADVVPGFPSGFQLANDSALWMPLVIRYGSAAFVDELLVSYRIASNLSLSVTSDVWMADNRNLLHLVFAEFKAHGQDTPELTAKLHRALKRHTIHTIANGIKVSNPGDKLGELRGYLNNYRSFLSPYGAKVLLQRVGALLLPEQIKASLRRSIRS